MPAPVTRLPLAPITRLPLVSVVIAARNAERTLPACLSSVRQVDYPHIELLVADDGSTDATARIAAEAGAVVVDAGGRGPSAARNLAVATSTGEVIAFTDADCTVPRGWLRPYVEALAGERVASAGGGQRQVFPPDDRGENAAIEAFFGLTARLADYTRVQGEAGEVAHVPSCNVAYRRDAFEAVGGFTEGLFPGEDIDLDFRLARLGFRAWFVPDVMVDHHRPGGLRWFSSMMRRYGRAEGRFVRTHGPWRPVDVVPAAVIGLAVVQLLWPGRGRWMAAALDGALVVAAMSALASVPTGRRLDVLRCALVAATQWNLGYLEGLRDEPPDAPQTVRTP